VDVNGDLIDHRAGDDVQVRVIEDPLHRGPPLGIGSRRIQGLPAWRNVASAMLERSGGISGIVVAAVPTIVFVVGNGLSSLYPALLATAAAAVLIFG
jgi:hypothetical protein